MTVKEIEERMQVINEELDVSYNPELILEYNMLQQELNWFEEDVIKTTEELDL